MNREQGLEMHKLGRVQQTERNIISHGECNMCLGCCMVQNTADGCIHRNGARPYAPWHHVRLCAE